MHTDVVECEDVGVFERSRRARLLREPRERMCIGSVGEDLDRDRPAEGSILGNEHRSGATATQLLLDEKPSREAVARYDGLVRAKVG